LSTDIPAHVEVLILGAGPAGIEAALCAREAGYTTCLLERDQVANSLAQWGHVHMFSPWSHNCSDRGRQILASNDHELPDARIYPTGRQFRELYLLPLVETVLTDCLFAGVEAIAVSRGGLLKEDCIGQIERTAPPFRVLWRCGEDEGTITSDYLIDATGVYGHSRASGAGGIPCPGELAADESGFIESRLVPIDESSRYAGRTTLVIGSGYSAASAVRDLCDLASGNPATRVIWVRRGTQPFPRIEDDVLEERDRVGLAMQELENNTPPCLELKPGREVTGFGAGTVLVRNRESGKTERLAVDQVLSLTGYMPDPSLLRELQVHLCYASEGLMNLSASLLSQTVGGDCLAVSTGEVEVLLNPEPGLFVLGSKSYGRFSQYLLRTGIKQAEQVFAEVIPPKIAGRA